jgi:hypothetical protein
MPIPHPGRALMDRPRNEWGLLPQDYGRESQEFTDPFGMVPLHSAQSRDKRLHYALKTREHREDTGKAGRTVPAEPANVRHLASGSYLQKPLPGFRSAESYQIRDNRRPAWSNSSNHPRRRQRTGALGADLGCPAALRVREARRPGRSRSCDCRTGSRDNRSTALSFPCGAQWRRSCRGPTGTRRFESRAGVRFGWCL